MANETIIRKAFKVIGDNGDLFSVTDDFTGIIHSVSDISGIPIFKIEDTGASTFTSSVTGITPISDFHLANKKYVDDVLLVPGADGLGWTGGSYNGTSGIVTFTSTDGLGFVTTDLRGAQGIQGITGADGADGADGSAGIGIPIGGTAGQFMTKVDATDYNTQWENATQGYAYDTIWAEESAGVGAGLYEWSFGNGDETLNGNGITIAYPCELFAIGVDGDGRYSVNIKKGTTTVATSNVSTTKNELTILGTPVQFIAGDIVNFQTSSVTTAGSTGNRVMAYFRYQLDGIKGDKGDQGDPGSGSDPNAWKISGGSTISTPTITGDATFVGSTIFTDSANNPFRIENTSGSDHFFTFGSTSSTVDGIIAFTDNAGGARNAIRMGNNITTISNRAISGIVQIAANTSTAGLSGEIIIATFTDTDITMIVPLTATSFIKSGGTSSQFLKANGTIDSSAYTTNIGDITGVTAGSGLSGGGTSGTVTLNLGTLTSNWTAGAFDIAVHDITLESDGIYFENGNHGITVNDGAGNFNIRVANIYNGSNEVCTEIGYAFHQEYAQTTGIWGFNISTASLSVGATVTWRQQIEITPTTVSLAYSGTNKLATSSAGITVTGTGTATDWILSSDESLKENISKIKVEKLEINYRSYNFKKSKQQRFGVIAQELEKSHPELVREGEDGLKSVSYIDLLVREVAYLKQENKDLKSRLERIEEKLALL